MPTANSVKSGVLPINDSCHYPDTPDSVLLYLQPCQTNKWGGGGEYNRNICRILEMAFFNYFHFPLFIFFSLGTQDHICLFEQLCDLIGKW